MNYWLFVTTAKNWKIITKKSIIGFPTRNKSAWSLLKEGDKCLIYIKRERGGEEFKESLVTGEYQAASATYVDNNRVFGKLDTNPGEVYPLRVRLKRLGTLNEPVPFKPIVRKLSFIRNKKSWGSVLQGRSLLNIPEKDYLEIVSAF